jgi:hypothetical protein
MFHLQQQIQETGIHLRAVIAIWVLDGDETDQRLLIENGQNPSRKPRIPVMIIWAASAVKISPVNLLRIAIPLALR